MYKFKVGDQVRIKRDFKNVETHNSPGIVDDMPSYAGGIYTIDEQRQTADRYTFREIPFVWCGDWLEYPEYDKELIIQENDLMDIFK